MKAPAQIALDDAHVPAVASTAPVRAPPMVAATLAWREP